MRKNGKLLCLLFCGLMSVATLGLGACNKEKGESLVPTTPPVEEKLEASLSLNMKSVNLPLFGKATIVATLKNSTEPIVWASSDEAVVTVQDGEVYGCKEGTATVTAKAGDLEVSCQVTVTKAGVDTEFAMLEDGMTLYLGSPYKLDKTVVANSVPVEGVEVTFVTEGDVFSVDQEGNVTALKEGEQTLKATATVNGVTILEGTYTIKIREYLSVKTGIAQNDLRLKLTNYYEDSLTEFALSQCQAVVGSETCDVEITYAVEDTDVAKIEEGKILPLKAGNTVVSMSFTSPKTGNTYTGNINVTVEKEVIQKDIDFLAKSATGTGRADFQNNVTGVTPIDLTGAGIDLTTFVAVYEGDKKLTANPHGDILNVTDASCGAVTLKVELEKVVYTIDGFIAQTIIENKADLLKFYSTYGSIYGNTVLTADIDMGGEELNGGSQWFRCIFDGRGHTISNFTTKYGIVTYISEGAHIKNVQYVNVVKDAGDETTKDGEDIGVFGLFGYSHTGFVSDVFIAGTIKNPAKKQAVFSGGEYSQAYYKNIVVAFDVVGASADTELVGTGVRYSGTGTGNRFENMRYIYDGEMKCCADYPEKKDARHYKTVSEYVATKDFGGFGGYWQTSETTIPVMNDLTAYFEKSVFLLDGNIEAGETVYISTTMACADITLKTPVDGIALNGDTLTIGESVALGTSITLVVKNAINNVTMEKTFKLRTADALTYSGKFVDATNGRGKLDLSKLDKTIEGVQAVTINGVDRNFETDGGILYYDSTETGNVTVFIATDTTVYTLDILQADNVITTGEQFVQWGHKDKGNMSVGKYTVLANDIKTSGTHYFGILPQNRVFDGLGYTIDGFGGGMGIVRYLDGANTTWKNVNYTNYNGDLVFYQFLGGVYENINISGTVTNGTNLLAYTINRANTVVKNCHIEVRHATDDKTVNLAGRGQDYNAFALIDTTIIVRNATVTENNLDLSKGSNYKIYDKDDFNFDGIEIVDTNYFAKVSGGTATFALSQMGENAPTTVSKLKLDGVEVKASVANGNLTYPAGLLGSAILMMETDKGEINIRIVHADNVITTYAEFNAWTNTKIAEGGKFDTYNYTVLANDITATGTNWFNGGYFYKTFDGLGHTITNFTGGKGLTDRIMPNAVWKNVNYVNATIAYDGGLFYYLAGGTIENVTVTAKLTTGTTILGYGINNSNGKIVNCTFNVTSTDNGARFLLGGETHYYGIAIVGTTVNYAGEIKTNCACCGNTTKITLTNCTINSNYKAQ